MGIIIQRSQGRLHAVNLSFQNIFQEYSNIDHNEGYDWTDTLETIYCNDVYTNVWVTVNNSFVTPMACAGLPNKAHSCVAMISFLHVFHILQAYETVNNTKLAIPSTPLHGRDAMAEWLRYRTPGCGLHVTLRPGVRIPVLPRVICGVALSRRLSSGGWLQST